MQFSFSNQLFSSSLLPFLLSTFFIFIFYFFFRFHASSSFNRELLPMREQGSMVSDFF